MDFIWNKYQKWCRVVILLQEGGETVCKDILFNMGVDMKNGRVIYQKLEQHRTDINKLARYQRVILLPNSKNVDTSKLDLSLQTHIIGILDKTKFPVMKELRDKRNELFHMEEGKRDMTEQTFKDYWDQLSKLLTGLNYDMKLLSSLKIDNYLSEQHKKRLGDILCYIQESMKRLDENTTHIMGITKDTNVLVQSTDQKVMKLNGSVDTMAEDITQIKEGTSKIVSLLGEGSISSKEQMCEGQTVKQFKQRKRRHSSSVDEVVVARCSSSDDEVYEGLCRTKLTPKMKDFIAYEMSEETCNNICREHLADESENRIKIENKKNYDRAYTVIGFLTDKQKVCNLSDMEKLLMPFDKSIFIKFKEKLKNEAAAKENRDDEDKSATLQKKHFNSLSQRIGDRWKRFARQFNIPDQKVVDITNECNREYDRCYKVFLVLEADHGMVKWKMVETALKEIKLNEIISEYTNLK